MELKKLIVIPIILFIFSILILLNNYLQTGDFIQKDIDLKGGALITIESDDLIDIDELETALSEEFGSVIINSLRTMSGYGVTIGIAADVDSEDVIEVVENTGVTIASRSVETVGPMLGEAFLSQITRVLIAAFVFMTIIVFLIYRSYVPSVLISLMSFANIITTIALMNFFGISISFAGFAALLMVLSYTVHTAIVLTTKSIKAGKEDFMKAYGQGLRTSIKILLCVVCSMIPALIFAISKILTTIAWVLIIGLLNDFVYTWIFNARILQMWLERKD